MKTIHKRLAAALVALALVLGVLPGGGLTLTALGHSVD